MSVSEAENAMSHPSREFHLIVDPLFQRDVDGATKTTRGRGRDLVVPDGVSVLVVPPGKPPFLVGDVEPDCTEHAFLLEPVVSRQRLLLLLIGQAGEAARINGQVAPPIAVLREKDQIQFDDELLFHVTLFSRPQISRVPDALVGNECPLCRVPFVAGTLVYACAICNAVMHLQGEEEPEETRLECAMTATECPVCHSPIEMTEGYRYEPEFYCDV